MNEEEMIDALIKGAVIFSSAAISTGAFPVIRTARRRLGIRRTDLDQYLTRREVVPGANSLVVDAVQTFRRRQ